MAHKPRGTRGLESHAWEGVLRFAGSILVLSVAFKNIGLDFTPVMQALTTNIANSVSHDNSAVMVKLDSIEKRLVRVEKLAHESSQTNED